ncbi:putative inactive protein kinase [Raphanus sativus]|nr:putative inactive protein kinase [Raphanus sativus]
MKRKENDDGFEYQTMDFDWNSGRYEERSEIPKKEAEGAEKEPKDTPTPPRGRIKANAAWKPETTTPEKWVAAKIAEAEHEKVVEEEKKAEEAENVAEEEAENVDEEEAEEEEQNKYTEEEKQGWILTVCKSKDAISAVETDGTEGAPARTGVKHRPKAMAVRKHRSRKADEPKKFTTPPVTKRTRARSQWVFTPFTEANTDEIERRQEESQNQGLEDIRICVV